MQTLVFFNNKGGVGKTTLACNVVSYLAKAKGKRVLLIDADPQCNATQAILPEKIIENIYIDETSEYKTLYSHLRPIEEGEPDIDEEVLPILSSKHRYGADLLPGHPRMSIAEDQLSEAWSDLIGAKLGGLRVTNWCHSLLKTLEGKYDLVVFDVGPSLGALNRTIILASDFLVTPFGSDIFSLLGIKNISSWIENWDRQYQKALDNIKDQHPNAVQKFNVIAETDEHFRFAGYSVQQYVTRKFKSGPRPVGSYDKIISQIPQTVDDAMSFLRPPSINSLDSKLGDIPFIYSLVPMSQASKTPIADLTGSEGIRGNQYGQVKNYQELMESFCGTLLGNLERAQNG